MEYYFHADHKAYPNLVTISQRCAKSCDLYEKQITCFALKRKCCRVIRMSYPNKPCSQDNLERVIDMQHCNPLIHQQFTESKIQIVMAECSLLRATRQIQHSYFKLCEKMASFWEKSREIWSSNYLRGPNSSV